MKPLTKKKHTSGPWRATVYRWPDGKLNGPAYVYAPNGPDTQRHICEVYDNDSLEQNANVLAASPDLLAAAKAALHLSKDWPDDKAHHEVAAQLEAAILKAEPA